MFSRLADKKIFQNRSFLFLITVVLLWLLQGACLLLLLLSIKTHFHQTIHDELERSLEHFLTRNRHIFSAPEIYATVLDEQSLGNLSFVRIVRNGEQLLFSVSTGSSLNFKKLAGLDPGKSGSWIQLHNGVHALVWNVLSVSPADRVVVQVGVVDNSLHELYGSLVRFFGFALAPALLLSFLIAYIGFRLSRVPLGLLSRRLQAIRAGENELMETSSVATREFGDISRNLNWIIGQNRSLVKEMQDSLDNVAHDLRTPMTRLRSAAEYGLQAGNDADKLRESLSDCLEEAERVLSMLKIMMSVAEAEAGVMRLEYSSFNLAKQLRSIVDLYEYSADEYEIGIGLDAPDISVSGDKIRLFQVWANLMDNGVKYNRPKGRVEIKAELQGKMVAVIFSDNGIGISDYEQGRIWDRLYRGDRSRSRQGLGLGLNYVRAVIEAHGGTVEVESRLNEGSSFVVRLPVAPDYDAIDKSQQLKSQISGA